MNFMIQNNNQNTPRPLYIGIDGGGSKCRAKVSSADGSIIGVGVSGRANPLHGLDKTIESILESTYLAIANAGLDASAIHELSAGVGLAGVNLPSLFDKVSNWEHPFKEMFLTTDLHIACLGAHAWKGDEPQNGAAIITGTGSCGIAIANGKAKIYGAHGFPLGDQSSGAWYGWQAICASLLAYDDLGPKTSILEKLCQKLDTDAPNITDLMSGKPPKEYAKLAYLIFSEAKAGDTVATGIVEKGADYINRMAHKIIDDYGVPLCLLGGLRTELVPWLDQKVQSYLSEPIDAPEDGAIRLAKSRRKQLHENFAESL
mgnify:CR=1 FL=1